MEVWENYSGTHVDRDREIRTVRLRLEGRGAYHIDRSAVLRSLSSLKISDVEFLWKEENVYEVFVTFKSNESANFLKNLGLFDVNKDVSAIVLQACDTISTVRFHWVPSYIKNSMFEEFLEFKGLKAMKEKVLFNEFDGLSNGIREFVVMGSIRDINKLPHILDCPMYNFQALIKIPGREPMCLKCHRLGHLRYQCTAGRQQQGPPRDPNNPWRGNQSAMPRSEDLGSIDSDSSVGEGDQTVINTQDSTRQVVNLESQVQNNESPNNIDSNSESASQNSATPGTSSQNEANKDNNDEGKDKPENINNVENDANTNNDQKEESDNEYDKYVDAETDDESIRGTQEGYHKSDRVAAKRRSERKGKMKAKNT